MFSQWYSTVLDVQSEVQYTISWVLGAWYRDNVKPPVARGCWNTCQLRQLSSTGVYTILYRNIQYCTEIHNTVKKYTILYRNTQYSKEIPNTVQKFTILYRNTQYCSEIHYTVLHNTVQYCTVLSPTELNRIAFFVLENQENRWWFVTLPAVFLLLVLWSDTKQVVQSTKLFNF